MAEAQEGAGAMTLAAPPITDDTPLRLAEAARLAFPDGGMTVAGLRRERDAGRLTTELIAGKEYVTLTAIREMRALCRGRRKDRDFGFAPKATAQTAGSAHQRNGSSAMDPALLALAAARKTVERLKQSSPATSSKATARKRQPIRKRRLLPMS